MTGARLADIERRLLSAVRWARVVAVDPGAARCRVTFGGETVSAWLPFSAARVGGARVWAPPVVGEQVIVVSPGGDTAQGVVMGSIPSDAFPAPASDGATYQINLPGGVIVSVAGGQVSITAPGTITITGDVIVTGDVVADGVSLKAHVHTGVSPGGALTGPPDA